MQRIAVVGCGYWGPNLVRSLREMSDAEVGVVCDLDRRKVEKLRQIDSRLAVTNDFDEVLADESLDAIVIATPADTHADLARRSLLAEKHTFVEKPLALTSTECVHLIDLAAEQDKILMVGHTFLYNDAVNQLKQIIEEGRLGDILYLHARRLNLGQIRQDINALWSLAPHDISILLHLLEKSPSRVIARGYDFLRQGTADVVSLTLEFADGQVAFIEASWLSPNKVRDLTVVGTKRMAVYNDVSLDAKLVLYDKGVENVPLATDNFGEFQYRLRYGEVTIPHLSMREPLRVELAHFLECLRTGRRPLSDGYNGLEVVEVLEAAQQSMDRGGKAIALAKKTTPNRSAGVPNREAATRGSK